MRLYRPTGMRELRLVFESGARAWPPRLPEQPIFYPVLNISYAAQIARDWNSTTEPFAGYVTRFEIDDEYAASFERRVVGGQQHEELWVPAEALDEFNAHIIGTIDVVAAFFGSEFAGEVAQRGPLAGLDAVAQLERLGGLLEEGNSFEEAALADPAATYLNFPFWCSKSPAPEFVPRLRSAWERSVGFELPSHEIETPTPC